MIRQLLFAAAFPAFALANGIKPEDEMLSARELAELMADQQIEFYDGGTARFGPGNAYSYTYDGGGTALGDYSIEAESRICIAFQNGFSRCDTYVRNGARLILITREGDRFPIRKRGPREG